MNIEIKEVQDVLIFKPLHHSLDALLSDDFKGRVLNIIQNGNERLLLDLSEVSFIDSSGLGVIITIYKKLKNKNNLHICGAQEHVLAIFEITGLKSLFHFYPSQQEGLHYP